MRWIFAAAAFAALAAISCTVQAQRTAKMQEPVRLNIGNIAQIDEKSPANWGLGGVEMITVKASEGRFTPEMRTQVFDARTVEILSRAQAPRVTSRDVRVMNENGHVYIVVRKYLLMEVQPQDAAAEGMSREQLASKWARKIGHVMAQVAPTPSEIGV